MKSITIATLLSSIVLTMLLASPADAAKKHKVRAHAGHAAARPVVVSQAGYVDPTLGPFGPGNTVIFSNRVIGVDPDPNIRFQILRDVGGGFFGGGSN